MGESNINLKQIKYNSLEEFLNEINHNFGLIQNSPIFRGLPGRKGDKGESGITRRGSSFLFLNKQRYKEYIEISTDDFEITPEQLTQLYLNAENDGKNFLSLFGENINSDITNQPINVVEYLVNNDMIILPSTHIYKFVDNRFIDTGIFFNQSANTLNILLGTIENNLSKKILDNIKNKINSVVNIEECGYSASLESSNLPISDNNDSQYIKIESIPVDNFKHKFTYISNDFTNESGNNKIKYSQIVGSPSEWVLFRNKLKSGDIRIPIEKFSRQYILLNGYKSSQNGISFVDIKNNKISSFSFHNGSFIMSPNIVSPNIFGLLLKDNNTMKYDGLFNLGGLNIVNSLKFSETSLGDNHDKVFDLKEIWNNQLSKGKSKLNLGLLYDESLGFRTITEIILHSNNIKFSDKLGLDGNRFLFINENGKLNYNHRLLNKDTIEQISETNNPYNYILNGHQWNQYLTETNETNRNNDLNFLSYNELFGPNSTKENYKQKLLTLYSNSFKLYSNEFFEKYIGNKNVFKLTNNKLLLNVSLNVIGDLLFEKIKSTNNKSNILLIDNNGNVTNSGLFIDTEEVDFERLIDNSVVKSQLIKQIGKKIKSVSDSLENNYTKTIDLQNDSVDLSINSLKTKSIIIKENILQYTNDKFLFNDVTVDVDNISKVTQFNNEKYHIFGTLNNTSKLFEVTNNKTKTDSYENNLVVLTGFLKKIITKVNTEKLSIDTIKNYQSNINLDFKLYNLFGKKIKLGEFNNNYHIESDNDTLNIGFLNSIVNVKSNIIKFSGKSSTNNPRFLYLKSNGLLSEFEDNPNNELLKLNEKLGGFTYDMLQLNSKVPQESIHSVISNVPSVFNFRYSNGRYEWNNIPHISQTELNHAISEISNTELFENKTDSYINKNKQLLNINDELFNVTNEGFVIGGSFGKRFLNFIFDFIQNVKDRFANTYSKDETDSKINLFIKEKLKYASMPIGTIIMWSYASHNLVMKNEQLKNSDLYVNYEWLGHTVKIPKGFKVLDGNNDIQLNTINKLPLMENRIDIQNSDDISTSNWNKKSRDISQPFIGPTKGDVLTFLSPNQRCIELSNTQQNVIHGMNIMVNIDGENSVPNNSETFNIKSKMNFFSVLYLIKVE